LLTGWYELVATRWQYAGDTTRWRTWADSARVRRVADLARDSTDVVARSDLADLLSQLGQHEAALREADRAAREMPESSDALSGNDMQLERALVRVRAGRLDEALDLLEPTIRGPCLLSAAILPMIPDIAVLRGNPRFERLVAQR